jgi:hypothetical protein
MVAVLIHTPVALKNALAIAAGTGADGSSPEPVDERSSRCTILTLSRGDSAKRHARRPAS